MEHFIKKLTNYSQDLETISLSLQKQEMLINAKAFKAQEKATLLNDEIEHLDQEEYHLDLKFQLLLEQIDFDSTLVPELNKAKRQREKLTAKQQQWHLHSSSIQNKKKRINQKVSILSIEKKKAFAIINRKLFDTYASVATDAKEDEAEEEGDDGDELNKEDQELIDKIVKKFKSVTLLSTKQQQHNNIIDTHHTESSAFNKRRMETHNSGLSNLTITHDHKNYQGKKQGFRFKTMESVPNPNKSFYLLHNKRLSDSVANLREISKEDIGGEFSCNCLLKVYHHNIAFTEKMRSKSVSSKQSNHMNTLHSSHKESRIMQKHKQEHIPTTIKNGRVIQKDIISVAVKSA